MKKAGKALTGLWAIKYTFRRKLACISRNCILYVPIRNQNPTN